jgi:alkanesulfonate monooxygenase SsuD/methylene tetrahydromethanopterin reductase-like flavin-dependent oxidoreductase (luciferase family)
VAKVEVGVEFWPWNPVPELVDYARQAARRYPFDCVWFCDEFQYEDPFTAMAAIAKELDVSVGTAVTFPWRNPLDLAQRFGSLAKLTRPGRTVNVGLGAGGSVQVQVVGEKKGNPIAVMRESVQLLRGLLAGESVELARFPRLAKRFGYNTETRAKLYFPPPQHSPVILAAGGPRMYELAGQEADGVMLTQLVAATSYRAAQKGMLKEVNDRIDAARAQANGSRPFKKVYNFHVSVSRDREQAWQWAKRNTSYGLSGAYLRYPEVLTAVGLDPEEVAYVAEVYPKGLGVDEAARRVSDDLVRRAGVTFGGTPEEVTEQLLDFKGYLDELGFDHWIIGVPLGPNVPEALELLSEEVIPAVVG